MVPLICFFLCMAMCMIFRSRAPGRRFCCRGGAGTAGLDEMRKEIRELKDEVNGFKGKKEDGNG